MPLDRFLDAVDGPQRRLVVANRTEPEPLQRMLDDLFAEQGVTVEETVEEAYDEDTVLLVEDGAVVATSPLAGLQDAILMVNSDLYITGGRDLAATDVPDVIDGLTETPFSLRGYPASNKEKLLLILISRHIERLAHQRGEGTLRSSFQQLSRLEDERGTRQAYERVAETDVDVHLYGQPDWTPSEGFPVTVHGGYKWDFQYSWFVLYNPPDGGESAALLAIEVEPGAWEGFWTYDESLVDDLAAYVRREL
jgi:hypothetical protein